MARVLLSGFMMRLGRRSGGLRIIGGGMSLIRRSDLDVMGVLMVALQKL